MIAAFFYDNATLVEKRSVKPEQDRIQRLLKKAKKNDWEAQKMLYLHFYPYVMGISLRYCSNKESAEEIVNDVFLKVFKKIQNKEKIHSLKALIRRLTINTAIDAYRYMKKYPPSVDISYANYAEESYSVLNKLNEEEIISLIQNLSHAYRLVFNLYVIEGFSHKEIGQKLGIKESTSKANLTKAKARLRIMLQKNYPEKVEHYERKKYR